MNEKRASRKPAVIYVGWVPAIIGDETFLRQFGFTGEIQNEKPPDGRAIFTNIHATKEVMDKACDVIPNFNWKSFTALDEDGDQTISQPYWEKPYPRRIHR